LGQFYDQAKAFLDDAEPRLKGRPVYLTADNIMRILLLSKGFAGLTGRMLRARYPWGSRPARLHMDIVADSELKGPEDEKVWREAIEEWPSRSRLSVELGVRKTARARLEPEEREPLLLLPDYVAGIYHHADPRTRLARPIVTPEQASSLVQGLRPSLGGRLYELP
jgi:hypothetical protein